MCWSLCNIQELKTAIPTAAGLLTIPLIVHPIDHGVHTLLDYTTRRILSKYSVGMDVVDNANATTAS
jgi:hypothetical protein